MSTIVCAACYLALGNAFAAGVTAGWTFFLSLVVHRVIDRRAQKQSPSRH